MLVLTFFIGLIANFIGYIPPGNINLSVVQLAINRQMKEALKFIISFSCVEFFFTFFIMSAADWLAHEVHLDTIIDWVMVLLFGTLGVVTWSHRRRPPAEKKESKGRSITYGILLGFLNPMQVPFWLITGSYVITHEWIRSGKLALGIFSAGSAAGAFLCLLIYARSARYIKSKLDLSTQVINTSIALLFFAFAAYHIVKQLYLHVLR